jgi:squalene synthase HpnC
VASQVLDDLERWGPSADAASLSLSEAETYTHRLATSHYENFPVVSRLLPRHLRQHFANVYAFCRWADDLGDETGDREQSLTLLAWWREQLRDCYAGRCVHPVFVALQETIHRYQIPIEPFDNLISAFEQDQHVTRYDTFEQLQDYCRRSADPVGRIVLYLCERHSERNVAWSDSICTGLQLTNFWQDVARDYDIGRVYLPGEDRLRFGYTDDALASRTTNAQFLELMRFQVERARQMLQAGLPLAAALPGRLGLCIDLFARGGLAVLNKIERQNYRVWEQRPKLSRFDLLRLTAGVSVNRLLAPFRPQPTSHRE